MRRGCINEERGWSECGKYVRTIKSHNMSHRRQHGIWVGESGGYIVYEWVEVWVAVRVGG